MFIAGVPIKVATVTSAGLANNSRGGATCSARPWSITATRVDDFGTRRYRVTLTVTVHADSLADAVADAAALIGDIT
jgi:hypothetical protein